jgi:two-component system, OmpR family, sensor histidine kinase VanS
VVRAVARRPGLSVRLKLTLSYAGFLVLAGALLLTVVWLYLLRFVPGNDDRGRLGIDPDRFLLLRVFTPPAALALLALLVFGLVGGWVLAGRMLAPLTRITEATRRAGTGSLSHRIRLPGRRDEFRDLADACDAMLGELEAQVDRQRRFAANASHELRTPLAVSRALLEVARQDPPRDPAGLLDRLHAVNTRAIDLTEALLLLSRGERGDLPRERTDLSLLAEEAAETLLPQAEARRITLDVTGGAAPVTGSAELLLRLVLNLVQNAIVHNVPGGTVAVRTGTRPGRSVLVVENTGPPVPPDLLPTLTEPFQRGSRRARDDEHPGVGLGLAIAHSVVRAHHGALDLQARPGGGLIAAARLPDDP